MDTQNPTTLDQRVTFRPVVMPDDEPFLRELYYTTRDDLARVLPDKTTLEQILSMQFQGQALTYAEQFPGADHQILFLDGEPVGRTMIEQRETMTYFIDFAILPSARGLGLGSWFLRRTFEESRRRGVPVTCHVEKGNRAIDLYHRLGMKIADDEATHYYMIWETGETN